VLFVIRLYILISSALNIFHRCRFYPTCSIYAYNAIELYGILKGCTLIVSRLLRCHPFCDGGVDYIQFTSQYIIKRPRKKNNKIV
jgi:putative membrane protein insertion efficiency factor